MKLPKQAQSVMQNAHPVRIRNSSGVTPSRPVPDDISLPPIYSPPRCPPECLSHILSCDGAAEMDFCLTKKGASHCLSCLYLW